MPDVTGLLELAKSTALRAGLRLLSTGGYRSYVYSNELPREVKSAADSVLEAEILTALSAAGLPVLSEECGFVAAQRTSAYWFIVDPLDGTFNYLRGLGACAVSIALWRESAPVFGVVYNLADRQLTWGGAGIGAYEGDRRISVSCTGNIAEAALCTGFPVRFDVANRPAMDAFFRRASRFSKVRMLGSAAVSLLHVARGSADAYWEDDIMLWDVAAGLAIVEGAGGVSFLESTSREWCYRVTAANAVLLPRARDLESAKS